MSELLGLVIQMSITASYAVLVIILLRPLLKKVPKFVSYALWAVVGSGVNPLEREKLRGGLRTC